MGARIEKPGFFETGESRLGKFGQEKNLNDPKNHDNPKNKDRLDKVMLGSILAFMKSDYGIWI